jgi:hypothetical protein
MWLETGLAVDANSTCSRPGLDVFVEQLLHDWQHTRNRGLAPLG